MAFNLPDSSYFALPISMWSHSRNSHESNNATLGDFLSGKFFEENNVKIRLENLVWFFKPSKKTGRKPSIDPSLYRDIKTIIDGKTMHEAVSRLRAYVAKNGKDNVVDGVKRLLWGATISARFDRNRRANEAMTKNKMITLDIDGVDTEATMQSLRELNICFWISRSVTGTGVYAIVPVLTDNLIGHFEAINLLMQEHGIKLDPLKDVTRLRYWSIPDDAIINIEVKPFEDVYEIPDEIKKYRGTKENPITSLGQTSQFDLDEYANACHRMGLKNASTNLKIDKGEIGEHLNSFIKYYHWAFNHYGISLQFAIDWTWDNFFKDNAYIISKGHSKEKIVSEFERFYNSYSQQHHIFDFDRLKNSCLSGVKYDLNLSLEYGFKLNSLTELPLIGENSTENDMDEWSKYILDSPTNSGKTTTFTRHFLSTKTKGLIVVPTQGALEQLAADNSEVKMFYEKTKNVSDDDLVIVTTYSSFMKLRRKINMFDRFLVVDEFHNVVLSSSKDFRNYELNYIMDNVMLFFKVVFMTGTHLKCHHPALEHFKKVKVTYKQDTLKNLSVVYHNSSNKWNSLINKINKYKGLQVIYMDDKQETGGLGRLLQQLKKNGFTDNEIQLANADQKREKEYKQLIEIGRVKPGCKLIIATKIFVEALNLYDNVEAFHIISPIHGAFMQQLVTRPRNNKQCDVFLYWKEEVKKDQDLTYWFDQNYFFQFQMELANKYLRTFEDSDWDDIHMKSLNGNDYVRKRLVNDIGTNHGLNDLSVGEKEWVLDYDYLNCDYLTQSYQVYAYKKNPKQLYEYLKQYSWVILPEEIVNSSVIDAVDDEQLAILKLIKEEKITRFIEGLVVDGPTENEIFLEDKRYKEELMDGHDDWQMGIRGRYSKLCKELTLEDANDLIKSLREHKRAYQTAMSKIKIRKALLDGQSDTREVADMIFNQFLLGSAWQSEDILATIQAIQKAKFRVLGNPIRTTTAATQFLNLYVETKRYKMHDPNGIPLPGRKKAYKQGVMIVSHHPLRNSNGEPIEPRSMIQKPALTIATAGLF